MAMDADPNNMRQGQARSTAEFSLDAQALARDWIDLWQSELSSLNADPEVREGWQAVATLWTGAMTTMLRTASQAGAAAKDDGAARCARAADAAGSAPAAAAPDARDAEIARLSRHVAALECRLAELERAGAAGAAAKRRSKRKP